MWPAVDSFTQNPVVEAAIAHGHDHALAERRKKKHVSGTAA